MPGLRVLAGTSLESLESISTLVNQNKPFELKSDAFEGKVIVNIKGFDGSDDCDYFKNPQRQGITWSIQVQGRFLKKYSSNDILFGNTFDRPLGLPWGSGAALKFMNYIDPTLEHDLTSSSKPWALSPLIATMPHFSHTQCDDLPAFPVETPLVDDTSQLYMAMDSSSPASSASSLDSNSSKKSTSSRFSFKKKKTIRPPPDVSNISTAAQRRTFFASEDNRRTITFGPHDTITTDFCYGFLEFHPALALRIPGGLTFDIMRYWDGQPVRFVCCERGTGGQAYGRIFWCLIIEPDTDVKSDKNASTDASMDDEGVD